MSGVKDTTVDDSKTKSKKNKKLQREKRKKEIQQQETQSASNAPPSATNANYAVSTAEGKNKHKKKTTNPVPQSAIDAAAALLQQTPMSRGEPVPKLIVKSIGDAEQKKREEECRKM